MFMKSILSSVFVLGLTLFGTSYGQTSGQNKSSMNPSPDELARLTAQSFTPRDFKYVKTAFAQFAPDSWIEALEKIPFQTFRCVIRVTMREQIKAQRNRTIAVDQIQINEILKNQCAEFDRIQAFGEAINATMEQLPDHVTQILISVFDRDFTLKILRIEIQFGPKMQQLTYDKMNSTVRDFILALKSITTEERQQMADVFPKLSSVILDSRLDKLFDLAIKCLDGDRNASREAPKLAQQIFGGIQTQMMNALKKVNETSNTYNDYEQGENAPDKRRRRDDGTDNLHFEETENVEAHEEEEDGNSESENGGEAASGEHNEAENKKRSADQQQLPPQAGQPAQAGQGVQQVPQAQPWPANDVPGNGSVGQPQPGQPPIVVAPPNNPSVVYHSEGKPLHFTGGNVPNVAAPVQQPSPQQQQQQGQNPNQPQQPVPNPAGNLNQASGVQNLLPQQAQPQQAQTP